MKKLTCLLLAVLLLAGCSADVPGETMPEIVLEPLVPVADAAAPEYVSRFDSVTEITLSDNGISVDGGAETGAVFTSRDIIYYEETDAYESGNPYGEGTDADKHTAQEAAEHTVVNITAPGAYRIRGQLSAGQIRIDLGEDAYENPDAVVELILDNVDISCTVAPAILFLNTYECDGSWSTDSAKPDVNTSSAGANLILEGENTVSGAYVAKIFKDAEGEKKLWKQDGAIYSYMSMNVFGPGKLDLTAGNEGLDTELHLTINGGDIAIRSDNDGINTNEDGVSVTTINGGNIHIIAGLGAEGDGIDSNGYLVINGGTVVASANPAADAGLDSDLGSFIHGGTVVALGSTMDWAESDSGQVTMNLQFAAYQDSGCAIIVTRADGTVVFAYDPSEDEVAAENARKYSGAILSCPYLNRGESYQLYLDGTVTGRDVGGVYDIFSISGYEGGIQMAYTGSDVMMRPMGGFGSQRPEGDFRGEKPEDLGGEMPQDFTRPDGERPEMPNGEMPQMPEGMEPPEGEIPEGGFKGNWNPMGSTEANGEANSIFYMQDMVNFFSGVAEVTQ